MFRESTNLFKRAALSLWMRALQKSRVQRMSARASRLRLHPSAVVPQQGTLEALLPSGATSAAIPPNHSLDGIRGSGSLTSPSHIHPRQRRTLERRTGSSSLPSTLRSPDSSRTLQRSLHRTCIYPLVSSPIGRFSRTRDATKEKPGQGCESGTLIRLYSPQDEATPTTRSAAEPSLPVPERMLGDDAGERETA
ncbi:hypothetical protein BKA70DRAFT_1317616 [Coprinopsis sp. MPI-PUGE-AT-0042]|nr:hypothetical protein BKA70DRAFT_1317616 [Coprinopsis sp. MPI-PUGE-AT-0042]